MRGVVAATVLAFLVSWAVAEWPRQTWRVVAGTVDRVENGRLIVGQHDIHLMDTTIIERVNGTPITSGEITDGHAVWVRFRCTPNHVPECVPQQVHLLTDVPLP
jgi:hypothetical protein